MTLCIIGNISQQLIFVHADSWISRTRWHSKLWHSIPQPLGNRDAIWVCFAYCGVEVISLRRRSGSRVGCYQQGYSNQGFRAGRMGQVQRLIVISIFGCSSMIDLSYEELDALFRVFLQHKGSHPSLLWHAPWFVRSVMSTFTHELMNKY